MVSGLHSETKSRSFCQITCREKPITLRVELKDVSHRFGALRLFKPVGACVSNGQILVVTGSNGSGKSTLLKMIAGLLVPDVGTIKVALDNAILDSELRRDILGYVAPDLSLYRELTGAEIEAECKKKMI